jgi:predicted PurR-regulated permease PerM
MKELLRVAVIVMLTLLGLIAVWEFRTVIVLFVLALLLTATFRPLVEALRKIRIPAGLSMALVYLLLASVVVGLSILVFPVITQELQQMAQDINQSYSGLYERFISNGPFKDTLSSRLPAPEDFISNLPAANRDEVTQVVVGTTMTAVEVITQGLLMLFLSVYLAADEIRFERLWLSVISPERRTLARQIVHDAEDSIGAYLRSELTQSIFVFAVLYALSSIIGLKYALIGSLVVALVWTIPIIGGLVALAWVGFTGALSSWPVMGAALLLTAALLGLTEFWLQPRLYRRDRFGSILVLLMMLVLGSTYGLLGLIAAPPLATAVQVALNGIMQAPTTPRLSVAVEQQPDLPPPPIDDAWQDLERELLELHRAAEEHDLPPSTLHLLERLTKLSEQTKTELGQTP